MQRSVLSLFLILGACGTAGGGSPTTGDSMSGTSDTSGGSTSDGTATSGTSTTGGTGTGATDGTTTGEPTCDPVPAGECKVHDDCASGYCETYASAPPDPESVCMEALPEGQIRLTATLRDWTDRETLSDVSMRIAGALDAAANPTTTQGIMTVTTDAMGRIAEETDKADGEAIGLVSLAEASGYYLTVTGIVEADISDGSYPPGAENHDLWLISESYLENLDAMLADDSQASPFLPLGDNGGVVGRVRDPECGNGVAGIELESRAGDQSTAIIRYLNEDKKGFNSEQTSSNGIFVILSPVLAEKFDGVDGGGNVVSEREATVGSTPGAIFAVTLTLLE